MNDVVTCMLAKSPIRGLAYFMLILMSSRFVKPVSPLYFAMFMYDV